jgi:hypothetical protein
VTEDGASHPDREAEVSGGHSRKVKPQGAEEKGPNRSRRSVGLKARRLRTAVYGPVRTVVWQGWAGDRSPMPLGRHRRFSTIFVRLLRGIFLQGIAQELQVVGRKQLIVTWLGLSTVEPFKLALSGGPAFSGNFRRIPLLIILDC